MSTTTRWSLKWPGYAAFWWVMIFAAFHGYWYLGGRFGLGDASDAIPEVTWDIESLTFTALTSLAFPVGAAVALATVQPWGRKAPRWAVASLLCLGCFVLIVRGGLGVTDEVLRATDILPNGLTGLSYEDVYGDSEPTAYTLWSGRVTDAIFLLGGVLFGVCARVFHASRRRLPTPS